MKIFDLKQIGIGKSTNTFLILVAVLLIIPQFLRLGNPFLMHIYLIFVIYAILAVSLNLIMGYTGQINLAHASFFGIGGYASAILVMTVGMNFWPALFLGGVAAAIIGFLLGLPSLRLRGIYFAMITFAFLQLMTMIFKHWKELTGGTLGLYGIPSPSVGGIALTPANRLPWIYVALGFLILTIFIVNRVTSSRIGNALLAIREDEDLAKSTGINTTRYKLLSFTIASFFAGIAGGLFGAYMGVISPIDFEMLPSLMLISMIVIGGMGTMLGPIIGTAVVQLLPEILRPIQGFYYLIFAIVIIVIVIRAPTGIMGGIRVLKDWVATRGSKSRVSPREV